MQAQNLSLKKFRMKEQLVFRKNENKGPVIVVLGRRDTGKTFLVTDICWHQRELLAGMVIAGSEMVNGHYANFVPGVFIKHEFSPKIIESVIKRQKGAMAVYNKAAAMGPTTFDARTFLIMDDCLFDEKWAKDRLVRFLFMNGRHWKVMFIIAMQYPLGIGPMLRTNVDYVFIMRENVMSNRRRIYENYASMFGSFEEFCTVLDATTTNYECLVIDNNVKSNNLSDQVFWYKAEERGPFKMCHPMYWEASKGKRQLEGDAYDGSNNHKKTGNLIVTKVGEKRGRYD